MMFAAVVDFSSSILDLRKAWPTYAMAFLVSTSNCLIVASHSMVAGADFVAVLLVASSC